MRRLKIKLAAARLNAGLRQVDIAKAMGVSNVTIVSWEKGKTEIGAKQLEQYCELCGVSVEDIFLP